jgi:hypothetical protein
MNYEIIEIEGIRFYMATRTSDGAIFEVPCVLDADGNINTDATKTKMEQHIKESDELITYIGE